MSMILIKPSMEYKQQVIEYKNEFIEDGDDLAGTSYLEEYDDYEEWMKFVIDNEKESTKHTEVSADVFLAIRKEDKSLVGMINIRHTYVRYFVKKN